ncbi:MAG: NADPH-dependent oxidoreductase, partial [Chitinophagaceae bacterium]
MNKFKIAVIVGSLRKESYNLKTAKALMELAPESFNMELLSIANLPMFNEDLEATPPQEWEDFRAKIRAADGLLFCTPEYNRSVPGVLK